MRKVVKLALVFAVVVLPAVGVAGASAQDGAALEAEVADAVAQLTATYGANDIEGYFALYAPELTWWGPSGRWDKAKYLAYWTEYIESTGGLASAENSDMQIAVAPGGDLAVASYILSVSRANPGDAAPTVTYQMSPTLMKRNGSWTIVHLHFQIVPEPE
ncbi:MAG TPA: nuclear transport factor 2 family protein [Acidobacteriota bacterium]|nr:nuclear transport factor 2 family protein [Acidobacteriota bacterium]